ncbi:ribosome small subunit-dependent GTPase A [Pollutimonas harenae]|uniref:Small ribosomal subunit biogenesis GTPase RsgA n=1 Tax=Pollutimonas harenae TaxID=657015 RepID=A0A853H5A1_9BURK|nr:ribosome small subunit-dependent GTPase A [Pollutimonas harenae]NYT85723.1 ribosome small subunit-dependent GTPase A [Pollutimonas harenae]TEA70793.1 ribosome small subunit-dependent GTPase A [Pollutimonas harenae]
MDKDPVLHGRIIAAHGRHYTAELPDGSLRKCFPRGKKAVAVVGDRVSIVPQGTEEGAIDQVLDRRNLLYRSDDVRTKQFAANVDQLLIVVAPEPMFSDDLLGRALVAAHSAGIEPFIVLNKIDLEAKLPRARERLALLSKANVRIIEVCATDPEQVHTALGHLLQGRSSLLLGQSGMGKSTLLNVLVPQAQAHTQEHSQALGTGKHTTTSTRLYSLPEGGDLIDSPGFQAFGLYHLSSTEIEQGFPEFSAEVEHCRFYNCTHRHEPGCGVLAALARGDISPERHELYKRILAENEAQGRY